MRAPFLSTHLSQSGKNAQKRFNNIFRKKIKNGGISLVIFTLAAILSMGILAGCSQKNFPADAEGKTAAVIKDAALYADTEKSEIALELKKGDLLYVIYNESKEFFYVQFPGMDSPVIYGYAPKKALSFDEYDLKSASYASLISGDVYNSPDENDFYENVFNYSASPTVRINDKKDGWIKVDLPGGDDGKWVKSDDVSYEIQPAKGCDLSYTSLQKDCDNGHKPYLLDAKETAVQYLSEKLALTDTELQTLSDMQDGENMQTASFNYTHNGKESLVRLYKPIKKDKSGIWAVSDEIIIHDIICATLPENTSIFTNSGMQWKIKIPENAEIINKEYGTSFNIDEEAAKLGIDAKRFYGKTIDFLMYDCDENGQSVSYIFAFEKTDLLAFKKIESKEAADMAKRILISVSEYTFK